MTDNVVANPGVGGATFASEDIGGVQYPVTKITLGAHGANDGPVSTANPMPVAGPVTVAGVATAVNQASEIAALGSPADVEAPADGSIIALLKRLRTLLGNALTITGTVTANFGTIAGAATDAMVQAVRDRLPAAFTAGGGVKVGITDALPAGSNTIGKLDQGAGGASAWKVDGSAATQPVSGTLGVSGVDVNLSTRATEATLALVKAKTDNLDVALSTRSTEATLAGVKTGTDKIPADPAREGGNLATIAGKDFSTSANQGLEIASLGSIDSKTGTTADRPAANSVLDRLYQLGAKIDRFGQIVATEATLKKLVAMTPAVKITSTLLHRS